MLAGRNHARGRTCTGTGDVLDVVSLWWSPAKAWATRANGMEPPAGAAPAGISLQKKSADCCMEAIWSQSPVLPWTERAYETCLSAGSTAVLADGHRKTEPPPGIAPGCPAYRADASLTMLWGHRKWSARDDLHVQGCLILSQVGLLFPVNHAPIKWHP